MGIPASDAHRVSPPQLPDPPHLVVSSHSVCTNIALNCVMGIVVSGICAQRVHVDSAVKSLGTSEVLSALQRICVVDGSPSFSIQAKDLFGGDRLALQAVTLFSMQVSPEVGDGDANFHQINDDSATQHENGKHHINYTPVKSVSHAVAAALSVLAEQQVIAFSSNSNIVDTFKIIPNKKQSQPIPSVALLVVSFGDMSMFGVETHSYGPFHCRYNMPLKSLVGSSNSLGDETDLVSCNVCHGILMGYICPLLAVNHTNTRVLDHQCDALQLPLSNLASNKQYNKLSLTMMYLEYNESTVQPNCVTCLWCLPKVILVRKQMVFNSADASLAHSAYCSVCKTDQYLIACASGRSYSVGMQVYLHRGIPNDTKITTQVSTVHPFDTKHVLALIC